MAGPAKRRTTKKKSARKGKAPKKYGLNPSFREAREISEIIPELMKKLGIATGKKHEIQQVWREVAGEEFANQTRVSNYRGGVLTIEVQSAPLLHELQVYYKGEFVKILRERLSVALTSLKFKLARPVPDDALDDRGKRFPWERLKTRRYYNDR